MITLPIYYTQHYKTKPSKTFMVGMNWFRNAHHHEQNAVKKYYHDLVAAGPLPSPTTSPFRLEIVVYYRNPASDGSNIASMFEKFILDSLQTLKIIPQDNVKHHYGTIWSVGGQDTANPRVEITLKDVNEITN